MFGCGREVDSVAEVVLIGPGKGNAMGPDFWREMPEVFARLDRDDDVRAIIVRGEGSHFSYGDRIGLASKNQSTDYAHFLAGSRTQVEEFKSSNKRSPPLR